MTSQTQIRSEEKILKVLEVAAQFRPKINWGLFHALCFFIRRKIGKEVFDGKYIFVASWAKPFGTILVSEKMAEDLAVLRRIGFLEPDSFEDLRLTPKGKEVAASLVIPEIDEEELKTIIDSALSQPAGDFVRKCHQLYCRDEYIPVG